VKITSFIFELLLNGELRQGVIAATARTQLYIIAAISFFAIFAIVCYLKHKPPGMQTLYDFVTINALETGYVWLSVTIFNITAGEVGGKIFFEYTALLITPCM
jgi:hypothetical protein